MAPPPPQKFRHGIVWGKFYPLHRGHQYLIQTATAACDHLTIVVSFRAGETIPQSIRCNWIRELFPAANVVALPPTLPYYPEECPTPDAFYQIWRKVCLAACPAPPDAAFTSEPSYDIFVRDYLHCPHILVDPPRAAIPISATAIRQNPRACSSFLHPIVAAYFIPTICIFGPESCGKSTLAARLAAHYHTAWQPEWARDYLGDRHCEYADMQIIAEGHLAAREPYKRLAQTVLFVDTDTLTTKIYSEEYYNRCPPRLLDIITLPENQNDFHLLLTPDVPWIPDTSRDLGSPQSRARMFTRFQNELLSRRLPHALISGPDFLSRLQQSITAVDTFLQSARVPCRPEPSPR